MSNKERSDKNVANIEEDIEILKKELFYYDEIYDEIHENLDDDTVNFYEALRHILVEREQDKKRIQELEEENTIQRHQIMQVFDRGYILQQKVKDALEDIEDYFERLNGPDEDIEYIRRVKQELLEGEK